MPECFSYAKVVGGIPSVLYAVVFIYAEVVVFVVKGLYVVYLSKCQLPVCYVIFERHNDAV